MDETASPAATRVSRGALWRRYFLRPALRIVLVVVGLVVLWAIAAPFVVRRFVARAKAAAPPGSPPLETLAAPFPRTDVNASARRLEELAATMGIDLATPEKPKRRRPSAESVKAFKEISPALSGFVNSQLKRGDGRLSRAPDVVLGYRARFAETLAAIEARLTGSEAPVWECNLAQGDEDPIPNLLGHMGLQRLLIVDALEKSRAGATREALTALDAAWKLNQSLWSRPELICQLIAIAANRMHLRALRLFEDVPAEWETRVASVETRTIFYRSVRMDTYILWKSSALRPEKAYVLARGIGRWLFVPYLEIGAADYAERRERMVARLEALGPCAFDPAALDRAALGKPEKWNITGGAMWSDNVADYAMRAVHRPLDQELTVLLLRLKRGADVPNPYPSSVCKGESWRWRRWEDGAVRDVEFSRRIVEKGREKRGWELPLRWFSRREAAS